MLQVQVSSHDYRDTKTVHDEPIEPTPPPHAHPMAVTPSLPLDTKTVYDEPIEPTPPPHAHPMAVTPSLPLPAAPYEAPTEAVLVSQSPVHDLEVNSILSPPLAPGKAPPVSEAVPVGADGDLLK